MSKTLYISDLDGTLLDSSASVPDTTVRVLNELISSGGYFSFATARTAVTAVPVTRKININVPVVLMNGVCVYDTVKKEYVKTERIPDKSFEEMNSVLKKFSLSGFLFTINDGVLETYYENLDSESARKFYTERKQRYGKAFLKTDDFMKCADRNAVYFSVTDRKEKLEPVYSLMKNISGLHIDFYRDVYNDEFWYMEVSSAAASKYNAVMFIRKKYGFGKVIGFGDNLNDLPLFRACDETYAVENAGPEVKEAASGIIPSNTDNGVAVKICELLKKPL
ncbi:MAG: HAD-IIB family hydrolase [Oscillospiraceae bacterium]|nr:HAD-IIB family hydrolase [Oscillospiraceae bacterium]